MIDYWKLTKDFKAGDTVQKYFPGYDALSPFVGRVTAVMPGIGFVDVQFPYGNERISPDELVIVNPSIKRFLPPTLDQSYDSYEIEKARKASNTPRVWRTTEVPPTFHRDLAQLWSRGASEVAAYDELWRRYASSVPDVLIRDEAQKFYLVGSNFVDVYLQQFVEAAASMAATNKVAAYWAAQNRHYRVTQQEMQTKRPACPRCGTSMRRTTYKMSKGERHRLFACPKDLYLIKRDNLLGPDGNPVVW